MAGAETADAVAAGDGYSRRGRHGGLEDWLDRADADLSAAIAENIRRIGDLWRVLQRLKLAAKESLVWRPIYQWLGVMIENTRAWLGGREDDVVQPHRERVEPFSGYRHAMKRASTGGGRSLGAGAPHLGGGATGKHPISRGVVFNRMALAPSRCTSRVPGEDAVIDQIDVDAAVRGSGVTKMDLELLTLADVGLTRNKAKRTRLGKAWIIEPAIESLRVGEALAELRRRHPDNGDVPRNVPAARHRLKSARNAVHGVLLERKLIPQSEPWRRQIPEIHDREPEGGADEFERDGRRYHRKAEAVEAHP